MFLLSNVNLLAESNGTCLRDCDTNCVCKVKYTSEISISYETPDEICLSDENQSIGENITKQICSTGKSDFSHGFSCGAGFSKEEEDGETDDFGITTCRCSNGK